MIREEAINFLKGYLDEEVYTEKCRNAHKMAIEALEQEPCENSVSEKEVTEQAGMTDKQFQGFIKLILKILNNALKKSPDNKDIKNLRDILNDML